VDICFTVSEKQTLLFLFYYFYLFNKINNVPSVFKINLNTLSVVYCCDLSILGWYQLQPLGEPESCLLSKILGWGSHIYAVGGG